jgi:hypothetical protein
MKRLSSLFILLILCAGAYSQGLKIVRYVVPPYPPTAKAVGAGGEVQILAALDKDGNVISVDGMSGHFLLRQVSKEAALKWVFEKSSMLEIPRSLTIAFYFNEGTVQVVEKSEKAFEEIAKATSPNYTRAELHLTTLVPKLLILPREKGKIKSERCPLHDEEMEVEILPILRDGEQITMSYVDETEAEDASDDQEEETYDEASKKYFPNANSFYYGNEMNSATENIEVHYCKTCRLKEKEWELTHKKAGRGF